MGNIFEIALLSDTSGYIFHSYINIQIPNYIKNMCNITDAIIKQPPTFNVIDGLIKFITQEELDVCLNTPIIISHGRYVSDLLLLLENQLAIM